MNYNYYVIGNKVVCTTRFGDKKFRATATCMPGDTFDEEVGKKLAKYRVDFKVALFKEKRERQEYLAIKEIKDMYEQYFTKHVNKLQKVSDEADACWEMLRDFENSLK